jgi:hypothetical protein
MILALLLAAQTTRSTDTLPPANPLPIEAQGGEQAVLAPIEAMFAGIAAGEAQVVLEQVRPDGSATAVSDKGVTRMSWADFATRIRPGGPRGDERLTDPAVEIDGDIAMVWSPYQYRLDGQLQHCGTDHFDLVRDGGRWRVLNVTWTQRAC